MERIRAGRTLIAPQLWVLWCALAQVATLLPAQTIPNGGADAGSVVLDVSPKVLDFGLVGMGRTSNLTFQVKNVGGGTVNGAATVTLPFRLDGGGYSMKSGESQTVTIYYSPKSARSESRSVTFTGARAPQVLVTGTGVKANNLPLPPHKLRVLTPEEVVHADFIVRYNDERTSYVLKPSMRETFGNGSFRSIFTRQEVVKLAAVRPRRELAIIVLPRFALLSGTGGAVSQSEDRTVEWQMNLKAFAGDLQSAGFRHLIVCRSDKNRADKIEGCPVLEARQAEVPGG
jgi:hypothetical protein